MPILWIQDGSPLTISVHSDGGEELGHLEVEDVDGKNAVWRLTDLRDPRPSNPVYDREFRMRPGGEEDGEFVLKLEFHPEDEEP